ncbi:MAG TPA: sigma-54 dependent transcriptional regulator [Thermoanaerobaculia bacterium]|nr:sigma-54 dependent transcriptional regulator [Thermoanaerobaculia bacterium]
MKILTIECGGLYAFGERVADILAQSSRRPFEVERLQVNGSPSPPELALSASRCRAEAVLLLLPEDPRQVRWLSTLAGRSSTVPLLAATEASDPEVLFELEQLGIGEVLAPPVTAANLLPRLWRLAAREAEAVPARAGGLFRLVGQSPAFSAQIAKVPKVAGCGVGVLIRGETGTGKELVARAIHEARPEPRGPFVAVNCGAIPVDLVENELFGHSRAAYTGADSDRPGLVEEAAGGTLFLDEVDSLPAAAQVKLLRFLQEKEFRRLGSTHTRKSDARVIAATNADVERAVETGRLRRDLYYRLNVVPFDLPPLRERREDVPLLARHFLERYSRELGRPVPALSPGVLETLAAYDWPGNVRELEHLLYRALVLLDGRTRVERRDIELPGDSRRLGEHAEPPSFREAKARMVERFEKSYLAEVLAASGGNISRAAQAAGKNRRAFFELLKKHRIDVADFRQH